MISKNGKKLTPAIGSAGLLKIMMNGSQIWPETQKEIPLSDTTAGDVLLWDKTSARKLFVQSDAISSYPSDSYTPIGVVVIPASHDVYGDGSCGVMSLKPMNCDTPSTGGTSEQNIYWGVYGTDISALPNLDQAPIVGTGSNVGNASSTVTGEEDYAYLPSDIFSAVQCPHDTDAYYYSSSSSYNQAPSPYLTDGSRNPAYYQTSSPSSSSNALADFDGIGNTEKIITQRGTKDYNSWTPNRTTEADYPAASCCDMFHTEGTSQGDWYLPACGELGYIMPPFNKINEAITNLKNIHGSSVGVELNTSNYYWSSTEYSSGNARNVYTNGGYVNHNGSKNGSNCVRAFLKVSPLDMSGVSPESAPNGVQVYANNGKLYSKEQWDTANNEKALGVAVVTDNCKFVVSKDLPMKNNIEWSEQISSTDVEGILTTDDEEIAQTDYAGKNNTDLIISNTENENSSNNAAHYCTSQEMNGNKGYLPSSGELYKIWENKDVIDQILILIGSKSIYDKAYEITNLPPYFWSSTEYNSDKSWFLYWTRTSSPLIHEYKGMKTSRLTAFPVFPLISSNPGGGGIDPESAQNGVYIYKNDGLLYKQEDWDTSENANAIGVAVIDDNCKFAITKGEKPQRAWSAFLHGIDVDGLTNYSDSSQAVTDFNGENNTAIIREAASGEDASNNAAHYCYNQTVSISGRGTVHGYLPALGELQTTYDNESEIKSALSKIEGVDMPFSNYLWSSTEFTANYAYSLNWLRGDLGIYTKNGHLYYAVPIFPL